jgi:hypothetical protein
VNHLREMDNGQTVHCLEVLHAVQTDSRTAGWYWGDVRGKAAVGAATGALQRKDLICAGVGASPFRLHIERRDVSENRSARLERVSVQYKPSCNYQTLCSCAGAAPGSTSLTA